MFSLSITLNMLRHQSDFHMIPNTFLILIYISKASSLDIVLTHR